MVRAWPIIFLCYAAGGEEAPGEGDCHQAQRGAPPTPLVWGKICMCFCRHVLSSLVSMYFGRLVWPCMTEICARSLVWVRATMLAGGEGESEGQGQGQGEGEGEGEGESQGEGNCFPLVLCFGAFVLLIFDPMHDWNLPAHLMRARTC